MSFVSAMALESAISAGNLTGGAGIAVIGMATVFFGLLVLSFLLPALKKWVEKQDSRGTSKRTETAEPGDKPPVSLTSEELAAMTAAIHAHFCFLDQVENMKLTWRDHEKPYSPWRLAGKAEHLQGSESLQNRIRSR